MIIFNYSYYKGKLVVLIYDEQLWAVAEMYREANVCVVRQREIYIWIPKSSVVNTCCAVYRMGWIVDDLDAQSSSFLITVFQLDPFYFFSFLSNHHLHSIIFSLVFHFYFLSTMSSLSPAMCDVVEVPAVSGDEIWVIF